MEPTPGPPQPELTELSQFEIDPRSVRMLDREYPEGGLDRGEHRLGSERQEEAGGAIRLLGPG
jgi:hypothetical protein